MTQSTTMNNLNSGTNHWKSGHSRNMNQNSAKRTLLMRKGMKWYKQRLTSNAKGNASPEKFNLTREQITQLRAEAQSLLKTDYHIYDEQKSSASNRDDFEWIRTVLVSGTVSDKLAAHTVLIQDSAVHNLRSVEILLRFVNTKGKRECAMAIDNLRDLFVGDLLVPKQKLRTFEELLNSVDPKWLLNDGNGDDDRKRFLIIAHVEDQIRANYKKFLDQLVTVSHDNLEALKLKSLRTLQDLFVQNPEQEKYILSCLINKLGDPTPKVASQTAHLLSQILSQHHPAMKIVIVKEVERLLFRPHITDRTQYYCLCFLSEMVFATKTDEELANLVCNVYFTIFNKCVKQGEINNKTMSILLTGVSRAFPYSNLDHAVLEKYLNTFYRILHFVNLNTGIQTLSLIFNLVKFGESGSLTDRFYATLYRFVQNPAIDQCSKCTLLLNVIYRAIKRDPIIKRVRAFVKRLLQVAMLSSSAFVISVLILISETIREKDGFKVEANILQSKQQRSIGGDDDNDAGNANLSSNGSNDDAIAEAINQGTTHLNDDDDDDDDDDVEVYYDVEDDEIVTGSDGEKQKSGGLAPPKPINDTNNSSNNNNNNDNNNNQEDDDNNNSSNSKSKKIGKKEDSKASWVYVNNRPTDKKSNKNDRVGAGTATTTTTITTKCSSYDIDARNPLYCAADREEIWELAAFEKHFHPTAKLFAQQISRNDSVEYDGNPLDDFTVKRFLDRFVFRNPKRSVRNNRKNVATDRPINVRAKVFGRSAVASNATVGHDLLALPEAAVPVDSQFIYRYLQQKKSLGLKNAAGDRDDENDSDIESVTSYEFNDVLDNYENYANDKSAMIDDIDFAKNYRENCKKGKKKRKDDDDDEDGDDDDDDDDFDEDEADFDEEFDDEMFGNDVDDDDDDEGGEDYDDDDFAALDLGLDGEKKRQNTANKARNAAPFAGKRGFSKITNDIFASAEEFAHILEQNDESDSDFELDTDGNAVNVEPHDGANQKNRKKSGTQMDKKRKRPSLGRKAARKKRSKTARDLDL